MVGHFIVLQHAVAFLQPLPGLPGGKGFYGAIELHSFGIVLPGKRRPCPQQQALRRRSIPHRRQNTAAALRFPLRQRRCRPQQKLPVISGKLQKQLLCHFRCGFIHQQQPLPI